MFAPLPRFAKPGERPKMGEFAHDEEPLVVLIATVGGSLVFVGVLAGFMWLCMQHPAFFLLFFVGWYFAWKFAKREQRKNEIGMSE